MNIPFTEPTNARYLFINPKSNSVHVLMPIVSGTQIGLDNTCKSVFALQSFFGKSHDLHQRAVVDELTAYKKALEFDIGLIDKHTAIKTKKEERLWQISLYITAIDAVLNSNILTPFNQAYPEYPLALQQIMKKANANLHSMALRPKEMDSFLRFVNPVFSVERTGPSVLFKTLSRAYQGVQNINNAKTGLIASVLASSAGQHHDFTGLQDVLTEETAKQLGVVVDFTHTDANIPVTKRLIDTILFCDEQNPATSEQYIAALLSACAPELFNTLKESPFYTGNDAEELSIITQFFLASVNIHCYSNTISASNFGEVLDNSEALSQEVATIVLSYNNTSIENSLLDFINNNRQYFALDRALTPVDCAQIKHKFTEHYNEIKQSPHFDEFIILNNSKKGLFVSHQGSICLDFAEFIQVALPELALGYFQLISTDFNTLKKEDITPTNPSVHANIELSVEELLTKITDEEQLQTVLDKLPLTQKNEVMASPHMKRLHVINFLTHIARGEQSEAENLLQANPDAHFLLQSERFTDYSGRTFNCTAFEYAYWAKDTYMCRLLIRYMDDETKREMLRRCEVMEVNGLTYFQNGNISNATHFDFKPLIEALEDYVDEFDQRNQIEQEATWLMVGFMQRDVPAHVAHEYCRLDLSFGRRLDFNEPSLPRVLTFCNREAEIEERWFPLPVGENSGLGIDFSICGFPGRNGAISRSWAAKGRSIRELAAINLFNEVRSAELTQLRNDLDVVEPRQRFGVT